MQYLCPILSPSPACHGALFQCYLQVKIHPLGRLSPLEPLSLSTNIHQSHRGQLVLGIEQDIGDTERAAVPFGQRCCWLDEEVGPGSVGTSHGDATIKWGHFQIDLVLPMLLVLLLKGIAPSHHILQFRYSPRVLNLLNLLNLSTLKFTKFIKCCKKPQGKMRCSAITEIWDGRVT